DVGLGLVLAANRPGIGLGHRDTHLLLGILELGFALEGGALLADLLLLVEQSDADGLLTLGFLDLGVALEAGRLLADLLFLFQKRQTDRLLAGGLARTDFAQLGGIRDLNGLLAL